MSHLVPSQPTEGNLARLWEHPVKELVQVPAPELCPEERERHRLYCLLVMSLVSEYWNGNKWGDAGDYPQRSTQRRTCGCGYGGGDYKGHNIACLAVDGTGGIIDLDFNHNYLFDSTVEHAEARLIRRLFNLNGIHDGWLRRDPSAGPRPKRLGTFLTDVTIYTTLEPCAQCAGIMTLGSVKSFTYIQTDPGQHSIGNILYNLGKLAGKYPPPLPIHAGSFGFEYSSILESGYIDFGSQMASGHFYSNDSYKDQGTSITSFLCTDNAKVAFSRALTEFKAMHQLVHPDYQPPVPQSGKTPMTNREVLEHAKDFLDYAIRDAKRGTPH